jgi:hypothetical protein
MAKAALRLPHPSSRGPAAGRILQYSRCEHWSPAGAACQVSDRCRPRRDGVSCGRIPAPGWRRLPRRRGVWLPDNRRGAAHPRHRIAPDRGSRVRTRLAAGGGSHERTRLCWKIPCYQRICREFRSIRLLRDTSAARKGERSQMLTGPIP